MKPDGSTLLFAALAHPLRRRILDLLKQTPGLTTADLTPLIGLSGVGVLKHVHILEKAGLLYSHKEGRLRRLYFNVVPIQIVYDRWTDEYSQFWAEHVADLKNRVESRSLHQAQRKQRHA